MAKIAVTGANGFVGKHLVTELVTHNYSVLAIGGSDLTSGQDSENVTWVNCDLSQESEVAKLNLSDVDAVIHLAGLAAVGPSFDSPMSYITTNAALEVNLFQKAIHDNVRPRFLLISSGSLYDPNSELPITEQTTVLPSSPYAVSKITQEQAGHYYGNRGFEVVIARPFNHFGPGQNTGFIAPDLAQQIVAVERGESTQISVGNLEAQRDYTDVRDIVKAYMALLANGVPGETYNICSGNPKSGNDVLNAMLQYTQLQPQIVTDPSRMRPADNPVIYGDHSKISKDAGWQPTIDFTTTIADVIEDWRSR